MKKPNITKGEWKYDKLSNTISTTDSSISGDIVVDEAAPTHATDSMQYSEANIKLICAAPDLAEALNEIVTWASVKNGKMNFSTSEEQFNQFKQALVKAGYTE